MLVYSENKNEKLNNIEIRKINYGDKADFLKLIVLGCNIMPEYITGMKIYLNNKAYDAIFGAFDVNTNALVGAALILDKSIASLNMPNPTKFPKNNTMYLDFLFVDKNYTHQKIGSNLINSVYGYCFEKGYKHIELLCPIKNSSKNNIYDNNDFNRIRFLGNEQSEFSHFLVFNANTNPYVRDFSKVLYATLLDAYKKDCCDYLKYKDDLCDGYIPTTFTKLKNISLPKFKKIVKSQTFSLFDDVLDSIITLGNSVFDTTDTLKKCLKIKRKEDLIVYKKPEQQPESRNYGYGSLDKYLQNYNLKQLNFVKQTMDETQNKLINSYILEELTK